MKMNYPLMAILSVALFLKSADGKLIYKTTNIECNTNPKRVSNVSCFVKAQNWNMAVAQMDCDLIVPLRNLSMHVQFFKKGYSNQYHPFLINVSFNVCELLSKKNFQPYATMTWKITKDYTNVNHSCPLVGRLTARNLYINEKFLPSFPLGFYMIELTNVEYYANKTSDFIGVIKFYVEAMEMVTPKPKKKLSSVTNEDMDNKVTKRFYL